MAVLVKPPKVVCEKLKSARMFLLGSINEIWHDAQANGTLTQDQLVTIRMSSTWAIQSSREIVNTLFHDCGSMAVFEANPFERRLRDIDTVAQQGQGRILHYETVGQVMLGLSPENIF